MSDQSSHSSEPEPDSAFIVLPEDLRSELKEPLGPIHTEVEDAFFGNEEGNRRIVAVGDIVTYHFLESGIVPDVSIVDGRTKRTEVDEEVVERWKEIPNALNVENPAATITLDLVEAIERALDSGGKTRIEVGGEEDLAALPAVALAGDGDLVVYGQPDEGMVFVEVDDEMRSRVVDLMSRMDVRSSDDFERVFTL